MTKRRVYYPTGTGTAEVRFEDRPIKTTGGWSRCTDELVGDAGEVVDNYGYASHHNDDEYWNDMWITN